MLHLCVHITVDSILEHLIASYSYVKINEKHKIESAGKKTESHKCDTLETWMEMIRSVKSKVTSLKPIKGVYSTSKMIDCI